MENFSTDPSVVHLIAAILPIASFTVVLDGNQAVCQGVLRAAGLQKLGAITAYTHSPTHAHIHTHTTHTLTHTCINGLTPLRGDP